MEKSQNVGTKNAFTPSLFVEETSLKILNKQFSTPYLSVRAMFDSCFNVGNDEMLTTVREKIKKNDCCNKHLHRSFNILFKKKFVVTKFLLFLILLQYPNYFYKDSH